jgi:iron complex transport system substrate-binding protein
MAPAASSDRNVDEVTEVIIGAAIRVYRDLGPGLLETVYEVILERMLRRCGLVVERQRLTAFEYDGMQFESALRLDLVVENLVVVELKSVEKRAPVHAKQLLTYLRLSGYSIGLLINFGAPTLRQGLRRVVNDLPPRASTRLRISRDDRATEGQ